MYQYFDSENISFDASLVIYIYSTTIPPIMIVNRIYRGADKSLARPTSRCILFDSENISFDASLVIQGVTGGKGQTSGGCSLC